MLLLNLGGIRIEVPTVDGRVEAQEDVIMENTVSTIGQYLRRSFRVDMKFNNYC